MSPKFPSSNLLLKLWLALRARPLAKILLVIVVVACWLVGWLAASLLLLLLFLFYEHSVNARRVRARNSLQQNISLPATATLGHDHDHGLPSICPVTPGLDLSKS
jgi:hypothetical protein